MSATESHDVRFRRIHLPDPGRVRNRYVCEVEEREVSHAEIGKGYELGRGRVIPVTDEELRRMPLPTARAIELVAFLPASSIDPSGSAPATTSSRKARSQPNPTYCCGRHWNSRRRWQWPSTRSAAGSAWGFSASEGDVIVLHAMLWDDEIRDPSSLVPAGVDLSEEEIAEAVHLIESLSATTWKARSSATGTRKPCAR
ncbi:Ku protein [Streptomyces sp. NPDC001020]